MGLWKEPKSLQTCAAQVMTKQLFLCAARCARDSYALLISRTISEKEYIDKITSILSSIQEHWISIPGYFGKLGESLKTALDDSTELSCLEIWEPLDHVISLALKVMLLDSVTIDRDYLNSCGLCSIQFALESVTCSILDKFRFNVKKLVVYGAMYPTIVETIISNSTDLKFLAISQVNLTDDLMHCISKCSSLEVLYFMHNYIWLAVSTNALYEGFFNRMPEESVVSKFRSEQELDVSFPNLKTLDIGTCMNKFVIEFYRHLLYYYDVKVVCCDWKTNVLEDERRYSTERLILPLLRKGKTLQLESLYLNSDFLSSATPPIIDLITEFMPSLNQFCVDCNLRNPYRNSAKRAGEKLKVIAKKSKNISKFYVNVTTDNLLTSATINPFLSDFGSALNSLTISTEYRGQNIGFNVLKQIINQCPNIEQLKLLFLTRYSIRYESDENITFQNETKITELWFHEVSPWDTEQGFSHETHTKNWLKILNNLLLSSPRLRILSVTACETIPELFTNLDSKTECFHLHIKDGCEWNVNETILINFIKRFSKLKKIFLEELDGETFWKVKKYFEGSSLNIFWGNLGGWPRS